MTRRVLTTIGSATAVATAVGACLLLGPTPQAQAADCSSTTGLFGISSTCIFGTSGGNTGYVSFTGGGHGQACAISGGQKTCRTF